MSKINPFFFLAQYNKIYIVKLDEVPNHESAANYIIRFNTKQKSFLSIGMTHSGVFVPKNGRHLRNLEKG